MKIKIKYYEEIKVDKFYSIESDGKPLTKVEMPPIEWVESVPYYVTYI